MPFPIPLIALAGLAAVPAAGCARYEVVPGPEQGMADAALVRKASGHDASPRSLGMTLALGSWRAVWAAPDGSEHGVFFFHAGRFVDVWGGPTSDRAGAFRWANRKVGAPAPLSRCFARRLTTQGL